MLPQSHPNEIDETLSIVVVAHNAEHQVHAFVHRLMDCAAELDTHFEVLFIDDGSQDETLLAVLELARIFPALSVCRHPHRYGEAAAIRTALRRARGTIVIFCGMDAPLNGWNLQKLWSRRNQPHLVSTDGHMSVSRDNDAGGLVTRQDSGRPDAFPCPAMATRSPNKNAAPGQFRHDRAGSKPPAPRLIVRRPRTEIPGRTNRARDAYFAAEQHLRDSFRRSRSGRRHF